MQKKFKSYTLNKIITSRSTMNPVELNDYIDFEIKRVYFITDIKQNTGAHCHKIEKEFFIMIQGSSTAVIDTGEGLQKFIFSGPSSAIYVPNYVWHGFEDLSSDAILLALSSTNYKPDRSDYVEDYQEFQKLNKMYYSHE